MDLDSNNKLNIIFHVVGGLGYDHRASSNIAKAIT